MRQCLFVAFILFAPACSSCECVPSALAKSHDLIDLSAPPDAHAPVDPGLLRDVATEFRKRTAGRHPGARPYHFLALSGGGLYGAFGVGVLNGWTESGSRPVFDVVTGVSAGSILATFAFLGPKYDEALRVDAVGVQTRDLMRLRPLVHIPFADALFGSAPLARRLEKSLTPGVLAEVAAAHAAGRRLYIGTTRLEPRKLVIWDMGEIASRGTAESLALYRDVVLASCSVPGAFPPVRIPVEIDGKPYTESHVDGATSDAVFFRAFMVGDLNRSNGRTGSLAPAGSTLYTVINGKLYSEADCERTWFVSILFASVDSLLSGKIRDELYRMYVNCLETGMDFRLVAVPQDLGVRGLSFQLKPEDQVALFEGGRRAGLAATTGQPWRDTPLGIDPSEQALPRTGTRFATPCGRQ